MLSEYFQVSDSDANFKRAWAHKKWQFQSSSEHELTLCRAGMSKHRAVQSSKQHYTISKVCLPQIILYLLSFLATIGNWENIKCLFINKLKDAIFVNCVQKVYFFHLKLFWSTVLQNMLMIQTNMGKKYKKSYCKKIKNHKKLCELCPKIELVRNIFCIVTQPIAEISATTQ